MAFVISGSGITTHDMADVTSEDLSITSDGIYEFGTVSHIEITDISNSLALIYFTSGSTATNFGYPEDIKWKGDDCEDYVFVPVENMRYEVIIDTLTNFATGHVSAFELDETEVS